MSYCDLGSDNLVVTWRAVVTGNGVKPLTPALDRMNAALGTAIRHYRISEWESGKHGRCPSPPVIGYMLQEVLPVLASDFGLGMEEAERLKNYLKIPGT